MVVEILHKSLKREQDNHEIWSTNIIYSKKDFLKIISNIVIIKHKKAKGV